MKKLLFFVFMTTICFVFTAKAQISADFLKNSGFKAVKTDKAPDIQDIEKAESSARNILNQKPRSLRNHNFPHLRHRPLSESQPNISWTKNAPFGLMWNATINDTRKQGIILTPIEDKDYPASYNTAQLPRPLQDIDVVNISFGNDNHLWRIIAYGHKITDDADASKVLRLYQIYSDLLTQKYGNKQQFFTPAQIDVTQKDEKGKDIIVKEDAPIGNPQFLSQLADGNAELYSTFNDEEIGVALAINVDGNKKSYIVIDYKNLKILKEKEQHTLDAL